MQLHSQFSSLIWIPASSMYTCIEEWFSVWRTARTVVRADSISCKNKSNWQTSAVQVEPSSNQMISASLFQLASILLLEDVHDGSAEEVYESDSSFFIIIFFNIFFGQYQSSAVQRARQDTISVVWWWQLFCKPLVNVLLNICNENREYSLIL